MTLVGLGWIRSYSPAGIVLHAAVGHRPAQPPFMAKRKARRVVADHWLLPIVGYVKELSVLPILGFSHCHTRENIMPFADPLVVQRIEKFLKKPIKPHFVTIFPVLDENI
jgi:hypothetical protein